MTILRGVTSLNSGASTTSTLVITMTAPAGIQAGDPMIVGIETREPQSTLTGWRAPAGWTLLGVTQTTGSGYIYYGIYGQNGLTGTSWTWDNGASNTTTSRWAASLVALDGTKVGAFHAGDLQAISGAGPVSPTITTTVPTYQVAIAGTRQNGGISWTWAAPWTEETDTDPFGSTNSAGSTSAVKDNDVAVAAGSYSAAATPSASVSAGYMGIVAFSVAIPSTINTTREGTATPSKFYVGSTAVTAMYVGTTKVYG